MELGNAACLKWRCAITITVVTLAAELIGPPLRTLASVQHEAHWAADFWKSSISNVSLYVRACLYPLLTRDQNVYERKSSGMVVIINLRHQVLFLEPIFQIFSGCVSQDDIYIDVLMGILSNFWGSMRSLAHGSGRISIYCHFVFCFKYPEHMSFNCVNFIMFSSCIYLLLRWEKVKDNCCKLFQRSFCSLRE